ncbi:hypothetical protein TNCV_3519051 [Trichonephila clavipes]|uniref:Uncharacterized protein n=1 Tax=Trichonephila clavipes TaxID=2585209 RepID=A0A8X6SUA9_TRICX|nr:hypothetical protein TNCV_3519051 [Trichonephila clavipes]
MAIDTSEDMGRSGLDHIAIWSRTTNFKTRHMPLSSSMSTAKSSKSSYISPTACLKQSHTRMVSFRPLMYGSMLPRGANILFDPGIH